MKKMSKILVTIVLMFMLIVNVRAVTAPFKVASVNTGTTDNPFYNVGGWRVGDKDSSFRFYQESTPVDFPNSGFYVLQTANTFEGVFCLDPYKEVTGAYEYTASGSPSVSCGLIAGLQGKDSDVSYLSGGLSEQDFSKVAQKGTTGTSNLSDTTYVASYKKIQYYLWRYQNFTVGSEPCPYDSTAGYAFTTTNYKKTDIDIANSTSSIMTLKGGYYISSPIKITRNSTMNLSVTGASGAFITSDQNATTGSNAIGLGIGATSGAPTTARIETSTYYVKIPAANVTAPINIKLTASSSAKGYKPIVQKYVHGDNQPLGSVTLNAKEFTDVDELTLNIEGASINLVKTNSINNNKPLANVEFGLYKEDGKTVATTINGKEVGTLKTDTKGKLSIAYIPEGVYVLKELNTLPGYNKQTEVVKFKVTVTNGNTTITDLTNYTDNKAKLVNITLDSKSKNTLNVKNEPIKQKFSKKDVTNEKEVEGAEIVITDTKGKEVLKFKSEKEPYEFYLEPGKYIMTETVAPKGYQKLETKFEFEVLENGTTKLLSTTNKLKMDGTNITLYNYPMVVKVPDTNKSSIIYIIIGSIIVIAGGTLAVLKLKQKQSK